MKAGKSSEIGRYLSRMRASIAHAGIFLLLKRKLKMMFGRRMSMKN